jgi:hypothetical protein
VKFPEFIATYILLGWGVLLLLPFDTFSTSIGYHILGSIMPENCWGYLTILSGLALLLGNLIHNYTLRKYSLLLSCLVWSVVFTSLFIANKASTGTIAYLGYALLSEWLFSEVNKQGRLARRFSE